jgi:hypothetical protein
MTPTARWFVPALLVTATGCAGMKKQALEDALVRIWNDGDLAVIDEAYEPELAHEMKRFVTENRELYPDLSVTIDEVIVRGPHWVSTWTVRGTHRDLHTPVTLRGVSVRRREGGRFVEELLVYDQKSLFDQLGFTVVPPAGAGAFPVQADR